MSPAFSIISPVYNCAQFVSRCYSTLQAQTFEDWEWVVVDDGSTDATAAAVRAVQDPRIRLISYAVNRGRGYARMQALDAARGDWMVVWDIDDLYFPDRLQRIAAARADGYDFCCSYAVVVDNDLRMKGVRGFHPARNGLPRHFVHHTLGCRMEVARRFGYDPAIATGEDATITWLLDAFFRGAFIDDALTIYQEEREASAVKAIATNRAHVAQLTRIYRERLLPLRLHQYCTLRIRWWMKRLILHLMAPVPALYRAAVAARSHGVVKPGYTLPAERTSFIEALHARR